MQYLSDGNHAKIHFQNGFFQGVGPGRVGVAEDRRALSSAPYPLYYKKSKLFLRACMEVQS